MTSPLISRAHPTAVRENPLTGTSVGFSRLEQMLHIVSDELTVQTTDGLFEINASVDDGVRLPRNGGSKSVCIPTVTQLNAAKWLVSELLKEDLDLGVALH